MSTFGERLESLRNGQTQKTFAREIGLPLNSYTNWVRGVREPSMSAIISLCTRLGVSADWLLGLPERSGGITQQATANGPGGHAVAVAHGSVVIPPGRGEPKDCANCKYKRLAEVIKAAL